MGLDKCIHMLQGDGCSPFFFTSALQSAYFGNEARKQQAEIVDSNLEFREHLQELRNEYAKERLDAQLLFRRESYELGRQYLIKQTIAQNESRQKQIEFRDFITRYWPLDIAPYTILKHQQHLMGGKSIVPLNIYVAKTELTSDKRKPDYYGQFCEDLIDGLRMLPNVTIEKCPWKNPCQSRLGEALNINYIMSGIPSLIIFPYRMGDTIGIETASWSFGRGLHSMTHNKALKIQGIESAAVVDTTFAAVKVIIGMTRDAYMIAEYHAPAVFQSLVEAKALAVPEIKKQLSTHYKNLSVLVEDERFRELCSLDEILQIESSLNNNKLLEG